MVVPELLQRLGLSEGTPDDSFERITRLAGRNAPVALAILADGDRQFVVSQVGLIGPWAPGCVSPATRSLCERVIRTAVPAILDGARSADGRPGAAYAGVPLVGAGATLGVLCLMDVRPRPWNDEEIAGLHDLAGALMSEIWLRLAVSDQRAAAEDLAADEHRYRSVVAAIGDGIVLQEADGTITACNAAAERMLGLSAEQLTGRTSADERWRAVHEDGSPFPGITHPAIQTLHTGVPQRGVVMGVYTPDGNLTWLSIATEPLGDLETALPNAVVSTFRDVTYERTAEADRARHASEQEALRTVATLVAGDARPGDVFAAAAEHLAALLDADFSAITRLEPAGGVRLVGAWSVGPHPIGQTGALVDLETATAVATTLRTGRISDFARYRGRLVAGTLARSGVAAPIHANGELWGAMSVGWKREGAADAHAAGHLADFANLVGLAVAGDEARELLSRQASTDHLTGLANQRAFSDRLSDDVRRARRHERELSLITLDIDDFKLVNDTHGHDAGNRALVEFAGRLIDLRRGGDIVARVGGEEFAWVLPEVEADVAVVIAERARATIANAPFAGIGRLTTSLGVCSLVDAGDAEELYRRADLALYWAKANGGNTIFRYVPEGGSTPSDDESALRLETARTLGAVRALARGIDAKDPATWRHSERVAALAAELARSAGWPPRRAALLRDAALVHDVGKVGVPDLILRKPGGLSAGEYEQVKIHAALGAEMVAGMLNPEQVRWIRHHHERPDGQGYPEGLTAAEIPEGAALLAVAEAWDAMTVARPYGVPRSVLDAIDEMRRAAGTQFSPHAIAALITLCDRADAPGPAVGTGSSPPAAT